MKSGWCLKCLRYLPGAEDGRCEAHRGVVVHDLKTWPVAFEDVWSGRKTFEIRKDDRGYLAGDTLCLREWTADTGYTGRAVAARVEYLVCGEWGLPSDLCVLQISVLVKRARVMLSFWQRGGDR